MIRTKIQKIAVFCAVAFTLSLSAQTSQAGNAIGLTYSSGFEDVLDWHEEHLYVDRSGLGLGISYRYIHDFNPNLRMDIGASYFGAWGDVEYSDLPLQLTIGYNFLPGATFKPYVRGGMTYHIMDGDYVEKEADFGLLGAVGVEIGSRANFFAEVSVDTAEATFSTSASTSAWTRSASEEDIKISDWMLTLGARF